MNLFKQTGTLADLNRAIAVYEEVFASTPKGHPCQAQRLHNFGIALLYRAMTSGSIEDINRAITADELAFPSIADDLPQDLVEMFNGLECALHWRFDATGSTEDLNRAIVTTENAVELTPDQCWVTMYTDYGFRWNRSTKDRSRSIFHRG